MENPIYKWMTGGTPMTETSMMTSIVFTLGPFPGSYEPHRLVYTDYNGVWGSQERG